MNTSEFKNTFWKYYLILEKNVLETEPYITFDPANESCFSNEFIKLYQVICSEIDVLCKAYCEYINIKNSTNDKYENIKDYAKSILTHRPNIIKQSVCLLDHTGYELIPWKEWSCDTNDHKNGSNPKNIAPSWWKQYNKIKHNRYNKDNNGEYHYQYACLKNILNSLAALYTLEKYIYADLATDETPPTKTPVLTLIPASKLFVPFINEQSILSFPDPALIIYQ